ncbi:MAG: twin-arginine translocase subunit TatC [Chloroflexi bacterium]|nr:twin-arginine translocase subunit TatC [Chloroflexota bacterium]
MAGEEIGRKLSLREHLAELQRRLIYSAIGVVLTTVAAFIFVDEVFEILKRPAGDIHLIFIKPTDLLSIYFSMGLKMGVAAASPIILLQIVRFVAPALYPREKRFVYVMLPAVLIAFVGGVVFAYAVLLPPALHFLLTFGSEIAEAQITVDSYYNLVTRLLFWVGIVFEMPIAMFILAKIGIVTARKLVHAWRFAIVGAFAAGALITPTPDPINMTLVAGPLIGLYGVSILLAHIARIGKDKEAGTQDPDGFDAPASRR